MNLESILGKGYFPEELPPSFNSKELSENYFYFWSSNRRNGGFNQKKITPLIPFSIPKIKNYRRHLGIPHPINYLALASTIVNHWQEINQYTEKSNLSVARLVYSKDSLKSIDKPNFEAFIDDRIKRSIGCRYVMRIDIEKCYDSIFIDSLKIALEKTGMKVEDIKRLIIECKRIQNNIPIGLPIGPDSSRIISELILASIDQELQSQINDLKGLRIVDDFYLYFNTLGEAEIASAIIQKTLKKYKLDLNQGKEKISELPEIMNAEWLHELREFSFRDEAPLQKRDIIAFFDRSVQLANRHPEDFVISFAVTRLRSVKFAEDNYNLVQPFLFNCLLLEPKVINYVAEFITKYIPKQHLFSEDLLKTGLEKFLINHLILKNEYEVCWVLWIYEKLKISLPDSVLNDLINFRNPFVMLLALDLYHKRLAPNLRVKDWEIYYSKENLYSEFWILAYEVVLKGWFKPKKNYISDDVFFSYFFDLDISFYDSNIELDLSKTKIPTSDHSG